MALDWLPIELIRKFIHEAMNRTGRLVEVDLTLERDLYERVVMEFAHVFSISRAKFPESFEVHGITFRPRVENRHVAEDTALSELIAATHAIATKYKLSHFEIVSVLGDLIKKFAGHAIDRQVEKRREQILREPLKERG